MGFSLAGFNRIRTFCRADEPWPSTLEIISLFMSSDFLSSTMGAIIPAGLGAFEISSDFLCGPSSLRGLLKLDFYGFVLVP